jgi:uncharacterized protein (DUF1501 family)
MELTPMEPSPVEPIPTSETPIALPPAPQRQSRLGRRAFLGLAGGAGALVALGAALGGPGWSELFGDGPAHRTAAMGQGRGSKLVLVTLYGGNDGLNTVIPLTDSTYTALRGSLAIEPSTALRLTDGYGLHPGMPGFKKLFDRRELAIVHGVGFADPNYSHFESMDIWQSGVPGDPVSTGWIGRWLDGTRSSPLRAISLGPTPPTALSGERVRGAAISAGPLTLPGGPLERALYGAMRFAPTGGSPLEAESAASDAVLLELDRSIGPILARTETSNPLHLAGADDQADGDAAQLAIANGGGGQASGDVLAVQLSVVANLILAGAGADVYSVELGGFDTHADQAPVQSTLLSQLDTSVTAFVDALRGTERGKDTVVLVYTEFGRRVGANASGGTDHGWANVAFVAGPSVKGGFYGEPPSLKRLSDGNTVFTTDFRSLYATMLGGVLGADPRSFLRGTFAPLPVV